MLKRIAASIMVIAMMTGFCVPVGYAASGLQDDDSEPFVVGVPGGLRDNRYENGDDGIHAQDGAGGETPPQGMHNSNVLPSEISNMATVGWIINGSTVDGGVSRRIEGTEFIADCTTAAAEDRGWHGTSAQVAVDLSFQAGTAVDPGDFSFTFSDFAYDDGDVSFEFNGVSNAVADVDGFSVSESRTVGGPVTYVIQNTQNVQGRHVRFLFSGKVCYTSKHDVSCFSKFDISLFDTSDSYVLSTRVLFDVQRASLDPDIGFGAGLPSGNRSPILRRWNKYVESRYGVTQQEYEDGMASGKVYVEIGHEMWVRNMERCQPWSIEFYPSNNGVVEGVCLQTWYNDTGHKMNFAVIDPSGRVRVDESSRPALGTGLTRNVYYFLCSFDKADVLDSDTGMVSMSGTGILSCTGEKSGHTVTSTSIQNVSEVFLVNESAGNVFSLSTSGASGRYAGNRIGALSILERGGVVSPSDVVKGISSYGNPVPAGALTMAGSFSVHNGNRNGYREGLDQYDASLAFDMLYAYTNTTGSEGMRLLGPSDYEFHSLRFKIADDVNVYNDAGYRLYTERSGYEEAVANGATVHVWVMTWDDPDTWTLDQSIPISKISKGNWSYAASNDSAGDFFAIDSGHFVDFVNDHVYRVKLSYDSSKYDTKLWMGCAVRLFGNGSTISRLVGEDGVSSLYLAPLVAGFSEAPAGSCDLFRDAPAVTLPGSDVSVPTAIVSEFSEFDHAYNGIPEGKYAFRLSYLNTWDYYPITRMRTRAEASLTASRIGPNGENSPVEGLTTGPTQYIRYCLLGEIQSDLQDPALFDNYLDSLPDSAAENTLSYRVWILVPDGLEFQGVRVDGKPYGAAILRVSKPHVNADLYTQYDLNWSVSTSYDYSVYQRSETPSSIIRDLTVVEDYKDTGRQFVQFTVDMDKTSIVNTYHGGYNGYGVGFGTVEIDVGHVSRRLPAGTYTAETGMVLLDGSGDPVNLFEFTGTAGRFIRWQDGAYYFYNSVSITMGETSASTGGVLAVSPAMQSAWSDSAKISIPGTGSTFDYQYRLSYVAQLDKASDLILFDSIEAGQSFQGTLQAVDLSSAIRLGYSPILYVNKQQIDVDVYCAMDPASVRDIIDKQAGGWVRVDDVANFDYGEIRSIAVSFGPQVFGADARNSVSVYLNMVAPGPTREMEYGDNVVSNGMFFIDRLGTSTTSRMVRGNEVDVIYDTSAEVMATKKVSVDGTSFGNAIDIYDDGTLYVYRIACTVRKGRATDVVLYDSLEDGTSSRFAGTVTGIDLSGCGDVPVGVYVQGNGISTDADVPAAIKRLPGSWHRIDAGAFDDWRKVRSIAVHAEDTVFGVDGLTELYVDIAMTSVLDGKNCPVSTWTDIPASKPGTDRILSNRMRVAFSVPGLDGYHDETSDPTIVRVLYDAPAPVFGSSSPLPRTGGIGTTSFRRAGAGLVICAAIICATRVIRRKYFRK